MKAWRGKIDDMVPKTQVPVTESQAGRKGKKGAIETPTAKH